MEAVVLFHCVSTTEARLHFDFEFELVQHEQGGVGRKVASGWSVIVVIKDCNLWRYFDLT